MIGALGLIGRVGGGRRLPPADAAEAADFTLSNSGMTTAWDVRLVGELLPVNAPAGSFFVLVDEPAGFAVVNG
jgi:hypothetical protein